ncbi:hypothetical protein VN97_g10830 [Penicillium thymicola]|uniref:Uncharacterized protein n=1 Tax=Penicillium thymicola TaxID=293382 RepID=A0AAI9T9C1_PENTH|nr:hypothetical protein VN97_g10830 [Penicillium thymicola]
MALKAAFLYEVTMFQPSRPLVKWSKVEKRLASKKGCSNEPLPKWANQKDLSQAIVPRVEYTRPVCPHSFANSIQYPSVRLVADLSLGFFAAVNILALQLKFLYH